MPAALRYLALLASIALLAVLLSLPLFYKVPNPLNSPLLREVHQWSHTLLFMGFQWGVLAVLGWRTAWNWATCVIVAALISLVAGCLVEWVQPWLGRIRSWADVQRNLAGIVVASGVFWTFRRSVPTAQRLLALSLTLLAFYWAGSGLWPWISAQLERNRSFPLLMDFDNTAQHRYLRRAAGGKLRIQRPPAAWSDARGFAAEVVMPGEYQWPGLQLINPYPDWSPYRRLEFDVFYTGAGHPSIAVNVYAAQPARRLWRFQTFQLRPGANRLVMELRDGSDQAPVTDLLIYARDQGADLTLWIDNLRLE